MHTHMYIMVVNKKGAMNLKQIKKGGFQGTKGKGK